MNVSSHTSDSDTYTSSQCTSPDSPNSLLSSLPPQRNPLAKRALRLLSTPRMSPIHEKQRRYSSIQHTLPYGSHNNHCDTLTEGPDHRRRRSGSNVIFNKPSVHPHTVNTYLHGEFSASQPAINFIGEADSFENSLSDDRFTDRSSGHFQSGNIAVAYPKLIKHSLEDLLHLPGPVAVSVPAVHKAESQHADWLKSANVDKSKPSTSFDSGNRRSSVAQTNSRPIMKPIPVAIPKVPNYKRVSFDNSAGASQIHSGASLICSSKSQIHGSQSQYNKRQDVHENTAAHSYVDFEIPPQTVNTLPRSYKSTSHSISNEVYRPKSHSLNERPLPTRSRLMSGNKQPLPIQTITESDTTNGSSSHTSPLSLLDENKQQTSNTGLHSVEGSTQFTRTNQRKELFSTHDTPSTQPLYQSSQSDSGSNSNTLVSYSDRSTQTVRMMSQPHIPLSRAQPLSMFSYTSLNHTKFPKRVRISKGMLYPSAGIALSVGHELNLHFIKRTKVVVMQDKKRNSYYLPLYTSLRVSILYIPSGSEKAKVKEFKYKSAGDVMCQKHIPLVIAATKSYNGGCEEKSVQSGEVLIVKGIKNDCHDGRCLKVQSANGTKKLLREKCIAHFTTKPSLTRLTMKEVFDSSIVLPQKVILHASSNFRQASVLPLDVTFSQYTSLTSVIATDAFLLVENVPSRVLEIPLSLDMELQETFGMSEAIQSKLLETTRRVHQAFDPRVTTYCFDIPNTVNHELQRSLYQDLGKINLQFGVELFKPSWNDSSHTSPHFTNCTNCSVLHTEQAAMLCGPSNASSRQAGCSKHELLSDEVTCIDYDGEITTLGDLVHRVRTLENQCTSTLQLLSTFSQQYEEVVSALNKIQDALPPPSSTAQDSDVMHTSNLCQLSPALAYGNSTEQDPMSITCMTSSLPTHSRIPCIAQAIDISNDASASGDVYDAKAPNSSTSSGILSTRNMKHLLPDPLAHISSDTKEQSVVRHLSTIHESQSCSLLSAPSSQCESHETTPNVSSDDVDIANFLPEREHLTNHIGPTTETFDKLLVKHESPGAHPIDELQQNRQESLSSPILPDESAPNKQGGYSSISLHAESYCQDSYCQDLTNIRYSDGSEGEPGQVRDNDKQHHSHSQMLENSRDEPTNSKVKLQSLHHTRIQPVAISSVSNGLMSAHLSTTETAQQSFVKSPTKSHNGVYLEGERYHNVQNQNINTANSITPKHVLQAISSAAVHALEPTMSDKQVQETVQFHQTGRSTQGDEHGKHLPDYEGTMSNHTLADPVKTTPNHVCNESAIPDTTSDWTVVSNSKATISNTCATEPYETWVQEGSADLDSMVDDISVWCSQLEAEVSLML